MEMLQGVERGGATRHLSIDFQNYFRLLPGSDRANEIIQRTLPRGY
jgi:hypothetical protein